jgi:hypothetical protein
MAGLIMTAGIHAQAQTPGDNGTAADRVHPLQLGPHTFAPMQNIPLPFVRTYLRTAIGLGQAWDISVPLLVIDTITILGLKGDLMFASLDFKYQHAVKDWMAVWAGVNIVGRLGTGVQSLLSEGVTAALGFELGTLFKLYESHRVSVAGTAKMINSDATVINVLNFVEGIVDSGRVVYPLVRNTPILSGDAGLRAAWSVSPFFGLYGKGTLGLTETEKAGEAARMYYNVGGGADFDLPAIGFIPVGVAAGYMQTDLSIQTQRAAVSRTAILAFSYRGRPDFSISLETTWEWLPSSVTNETIEAGSLMLMTQYFF